MAGNSFPTTLTRAEILHACAAVLAIMATADAKAMFFRYISLSLVDDDRLRCQLKLPQ
jgi:hypothetical protein